ncbi:toll-like receptor 13 [Mytilus trossulus]|uniref:toll-like receptor 13 n=1 Tax=Mytilus trossulus TaxID=6551 RepID=UPI0030040657
MTKTYSHVVFVCCFVCFIIYTVDCQTLNEKLALLLNRNDLICPAECQYTAVHPYFEDDMECCVCFAQPYWMLNTSNVGLLSISFLQDDTPSIIYKNGSNFGLYNVSYQYGNLTFIPNDSCNISGIVYIDFSYNSISDLATISCISTLDTLILKGNSVKYLKNNVFSGMRYLRVVDLSYNKLRTIQPELLLHIDGSLLHFDVSNNLMENIDITNIIWDKQDYFCVANFSHNIIKHMTNLKGWSCDIHSDLGRGGYVDFTYNNFTIFLNIAEMGFYDINLLGKLYFYSFDFRFNLWFCDCRFFPLTSKSNIANQILGSAHHGLKCYSPSEFHNKSVSDFVKEQDKLICNISFADKCPPNCRCFYQPSKNRTVVNCRSSLVSRKLPLVLPDYDNLVIDFSSNRISDLKAEFQRLLSEERTYLVRVKEISFASNALQDVPNIVFVTFKNATMINLTSNPINILSESLKLIRPRAVSFGRVDLKCVCKDIWLQNWLLSAGRFYNNTQIMCHTSSGVKSILEIDKDILECENESVVTRWITFSLGISLFCIIVSFFVIYNFRIDVYILFREHARLFRKTTNPLSFEYEVYISCNEQDENLRHWITNILLPYLQERRINVFLPYRDCLPGTPREDDIREKMSKSRNVLIILSEVYDDISKRWLACELRYSRLNYRYDWRKNIVILNYDFLKTKEIPDDFIQAFVRLGKCVDFSNYQKDIKVEIYSLLYH